jgi:hypothetical protein
MIYLWLLVPIAICLLGAVCAGDLRLTAKQEREWEAYWASLSPEERERMARIAWGYL